MTTHTHTSVCLGRALTSVLDGRVWGQTAVGSSWHGTENCNSPTAPKNTPVRMVGVGVKGVRAPCVWTQVVCVILLMQMQTFTFRPD